MSLNIKNERTHAAVRELATLRGVSQTEAVDEAVRARLIELGAGRERDRRFMRTMEIANDTRRMLQDARVRLTTDDLYDEHGLPR